jgi:hypothetical protein
LGQLGIRRQLGIFQHRVRRLNYRRPGSGFFNTGVTAPIFGQPSGVHSGYNSGLLNIGTGIAGLFSLARLLP